MALDFISEADNKFIADNLLSSEDWGDPGFYHGDSLDDLTDGVDFSSRLQDVLSPSNELMSNDAPRNDLTSVDLNGDLAKAWLGIADEEQLAGLNDGYSIKNEPLSPPPSSESSETSSESSQGSQVLPNGHHNHIHIKLESPPLTPPRESLSDSPSPLGCGQQTIFTIASGNLPNRVTKSLANGVINGAKKGVAIAPKPRNGVLQLPIAPKLESVATTMSIQSPTKPTVTVKQIPAAVRPPIVVQQNTPSIFATANGSCGPPPAKQAKVIPMSHHTSIPSSPQPVAVVTQPCPPDVDVKAWKRQQRMIKNRESACLSRKKKKEYLQELEYKTHGLEKEIARLRSENSNLRNKVEVLVKENSTLKKMQSSIFSSPARTASCLLAIVFIIGFNFAPISLFSQNNINSEYELQHHGGRALLAFSENSNQSTSHLYGQSQANQVLDITAEDVLLWQSIANQSASANGGAIATKMDIQYLLSLSNFSCPHQMNISETIRLTDVLQFWAKRQSVEQEKSKEEEQEKKKKKRRQPLYRRFRSTPALHVESDERALQLYDHLFQQSYDNLLDALNRRDDTFYVVSFRKDHLLLPATAHNNTHRPKMSLVMPTVSGNESMWNTPKDHISMMQIDCEVVDTKVVHVKDHGSPPPVVNNASHHPPAPSNSQRSNHSQSQRGAATAFVGTDNDHTLGYHPRNLSSNNP